MVFPYFILIGITNVYARLFNASTTSNSNQDEVWIVFLAIIGFVVLMFRIALAAAEREENRYTIKLSSSETEVEDMPGKKVLRLQWVDMLNADKGTKHYILRKSYGKYARKVMDLGATDDFCFIDRFYQDGVHQNYVIVCMEDNRTSNAVTRNYSY